MYFKYDFVPFFSPLKWNKFNEILVIDFQITWTHIIPISDIIRLKLSHKIVSWIFKAFFFQIFCRKLIIWATKLNPFKKQFFSVVENLAFRRNNISRWWIDFLTNFSNSYWSLNDNLTIIVLNNTSSLDYNATVFSKVSN